MTTVALKEPLLSIEPSVELRFKGPFKDIVTAYIKLTNPGNRGVCFKVKTTAPRRYCVRPNCGVVSAKSSASVMVMLQPFEYDPSEKNKHKFMVQATAEPPSYSSLDQVWKEAKPEEVTEAKLKCVFELPGGENDFVVNDVATPKVVKNLEAEPQEHTQPKSTDEDVQALKDKVSFLNKENLQLKDEVARLKKGNYYPPGGVMPHGLANKPPHLEAATWNIYLICSIVAVIVGLIVGKLFL